MTVDGGWSTLYALNAIADAQTTTKETDDMADENTITTDTTIRIDREREVAVYVHASGAVTLSVEDPDTVAIVAIPPAQLAELHAAIGDALTATTKRDATPAELLDEPDGVLESMANGDLDVTEATRHLAQAELDSRRSRRDR